MKPEENWFGPTNGSSVSLTDRSVCTEMCVWLGVYVRRINDDTRLFNKLSSECGWLEAAVIDAALAQ